MEYMEMLKRENFNIRDHVEVNRKRDPQKCWALHSLIGYTSFIHQPKGKRESITGAKFERQRKGKEVKSKNPSAIAGSEYESQRKGNEVESENPAAITGSQYEGQRQGKEVEYPNPAAIAGSKYERKRKGKEVKSKNPAGSKYERKRKANEVQSKKSAARTGSKYARQRKGKQAESKNPAGNANNFTLDDEEYADDLTLADFLRKKSSLRKQKADETRLIVAQPPPAGSCGELGRLSFPGSVSRVHEPVVEVCKDKGKQKITEFEETRLPVAKRWPGGEIGGLRPPGSVSRVHEPVVRVRREGKQKMTQFEETRPVVAKRLPGALYGKLKPWNPDLVVCSKNMNPSEFSTEIAKKFMRKVIE